MNVTHSFLTKQSPPVPIILKKYIKTSKRNWNSPERNSLLVVVVMLQNNMKKKDYWEHLFYTADTDNGISFCKLLVCCLRGMQRSIRIVVVFPQILPFTTSIYNVNPMRFRMSLKTCGEYHARGDVRVFDSFVWISLYSQLFHFKSPTSNQTN